MMSLENNNNMELKDGSLNPRTYNGRGKGESEAIYLIIYFLLPERFITHAAIFLDCFYVNILES